MKLDRTEVRKFHENTKKGKQVIKNTKKKEYKQKELCFKCEQKGHIAKICFSKQTSNPGTSSNTNTNIEQVNLIEKEVNVCNSGVFKDFINVQFVETHQLMINESIEESQQ
ncbi:34740_t:CDS:2 [Racocetra persica]|uniref:34740_t:CDS:1 n=1 Tax=Racocetra persica TaxID=160502 RepID=A0ACA9KBJ1_9GLOM|nr:34740_t:CDS:2 [Racocetra persica]